MNLDEIKKLSEIFTNIAQPIATLIVGILAVKSQTTKRELKKEIIL